MNDNDIEKLIKAAHDAGSALLEFFNNRTFNVDLKKDGSYVTCADLIANNIIVEKLSIHFPTIPIISEEIKHNINVKKQKLKRYWLIDPLDGTTDFVKGNINFTVNIALIEDSIPIFGLIYHPVNDILYYTSNLASNKLIIQNANSKVELLKNENLTKNTSNIRLIIGCKSKITQKLKNYFDKAIITEISKVSSSIKFCYIAENRADLYLRFGRTMEWDTAAGDAILRCIGGGLLDSNNELLKYGKRNLANKFFYAINNLNLKL